MDQVLVGKCIPHLITILLLLLLPWANRETGVSTLTPLTSPACAVEGTYRMGLGSWAYSWYATSRDMAFRCLISGEF